MDYIFWLIIGLVLMAIELVIPGGIAGLIGYCFYYHLFDSVVIRDYRAWERKIKKAVPVSPEQLFVYCILA